MYLLNLDLMLPLLLLYFHLHSTMYLLNPESSSAVYFSRRFTFHYVSIKSKSISIPAIICTQFTFHYVSIKSPYRNTLSFLKPILCFFVDLPSFMVTKYVYIRNFLYSPHNYYIVDVPVFLQHFRSTTQQVLDKEASCVIFHSPEFFI